MSAIGKTVFARKNVIPYRKLLPKLVPYEEQKNYRVSLKSFPDYKHLFQEYYLEYNIFFYHYLS
jgi:hypothetical protein